VSNKKCPQYQPRQALTDKVKDTKEQTATVKLGLNSFLAAPAAPTRPTLEPIIQDAVRRMTSLSFDASRLANLYVLWLLENDRDMPNMSYSSFMRLPFQAALRRSTDQPHIAKATKIEDLNQVRDTLYSPCRPPGAEWTDGR
jgi:hypothetical protein